MAEPGPRIVSINELRFRPANSNDRARAGLEHAFTDVPRCSFAKDDGISPYIAADAGIKDFPDNPADHAVLHSDVPDVSHGGGAPALSLSQKLLRTGFGLSVFLHAAAAVAIGYLAAVKLPDDTLLEGETVIAVEFYSETDSEVTTRTQQVEQEGDDQAVEEPKVEPEPVAEEKPVEVARPVEQPVEKPVEIPVETVPQVEQPVAVTDQPEVLSTTEPSSFQIEAAGRQILEETRIEPLPDTVPPMLIAPVEDKQPEPETKLAQPLPHPVSRPRVVEKAAEVKPAEVKPVEQPVVRKEEPKPVERKPEPRPVEPKKAEPRKEQAKKPQETPAKETRTKKVVARDGNAETDSNKGSSTARRKDGSSQDASQGGSKNRLKGNAAKSNYDGILQRRIERAKKRVSVTGRGSVTVAFTISANGRVTSLSIRKSSGKPALDKGALDIIRRASPFPPFPDGLNVPQLKKVVPMTFRGR